MRPGDRFCSHCGEPPKLSAAQPGGSACKCGAVIESDAKFCGECGQAAPILCIECGGLVEGGDRFCRACGHIVTDGPQAHLTPHPREFLLEEQRKIRHEYFDFVSVGDTNGVLYWLGTGSISLTFSRVLTVA